MTAYYNEIDPYAAQWLRNLIAGGLIAPGIVDERSIVDVEPAELSQYSQCHFFAGIGIWSHALRSAGWPDDRPVWTGSCPCQPFSAAGQGGGFTDERHLWPAFHHLIRVCRPAVVFGEQVASKDGLAWLDLVSADLEGEDYSVGALDICAAGFGAPHIRQRLYWAANTELSVGRSLYGDREDGRNGPDSGRKEAHCFARARGQVHGLADDYYYSGSQVGGERSVGEHDSQGREISVGFARLCGESGGLANTSSPRPFSSPHAGVHCGEEIPRSWDGESERSGPIGSPGPTNGRWRDPDWLFCRDGKWRSVESGSFPLAYGVTNRVGQLRAYGNAIVAPQATEFVKSYMEAVA